MRGVGQQSVVETSAVNCDGDKEKKKKRRSNRRSKQTPPASGFLFSYFFFSGYFGQFITGFWGFCTKIHFG
jgi:hypothetical protein